MIPYDLFAAYLKHRLVTDQGKHIPEGLPTVPDSENRHQVIPFTGTPDGDDWIRMAGLDDLSQRITIAYGIWHNPQARCLAMVPTFREDVDLKDILYRAGKWNVSENDLALYRRLFWDDHGFCAIDWYEYLEKVDGLDREILTDLLGDTPTEAILHKLGVHQIPPTFTDYLSRMAARGFAEFSASNGDSAIKWGNFTMKAIDKLQNLSDQNDVKKIIKELEIEVAMPELVHSLIEGEIV